MAKKTDYDDAYLGDGTRISLPDIKLELHPLRGHAFVLAVLTPDGECVGWLDVEYAGHDSVKEWMSAVRWKGPK